MIYFTFEFFLIEKCMPILNFRNRETVNVEAQVIVDHSVRRSGQSDLA